MWLARRTLTLLIAFAISLPVAAAPAAAAAGAPFDWACAPGAEHAHEAAAELGLAPAGRGGKYREPKLDQASAADMPGWAKNRARPDLKVTVDVYFHVITDGAVGNLTSRQISSQIAVLNHTFAGREGGANTGFSFNLAGVTRTDNAKWYAARGGVENEFKKALKVGGDSDLNVYSTSGWLYLGWAYYPSITDTNQSHLDGIVIDWRTVPGASDAYAGRYDQGETLTHEAGHWLNLAHTFENGCKEPGDFVDDTPPQATPTSGCPEGKDTCPAPGLDPIHNYMDYSFDTCYTEFTAGQSQRMLDAWLLYRES